MFRSAAKGFLLGFYFLCCAAFGTAFWPYIKDFYLHLSEVLTGSYVLPAIPLSLQLNFLLFALVNAVGFAQIFEILNKKD